MKKQNSSLQTKKHVVQLGPQDNPIDIRYDEVFKAVFTSESAESRMALTKLVSAMLGQEVSMLRIVENEPAITNSKDRKIRLDINCRTENGERINVEMCFNPDFYEPDRLEYHIGRLFTSQQVRGKRGYKTLKKAYQIAILAKLQFFPDDEFFHCFEYYDKLRGVSLNGRTKIITVELTKLDKIIEKPVTELSVQERWALYFEYLTDTKYRDIINDIIKHEEGITMATKALMRITRSDREWAYRESKLKYELDRQTLIYETKRAGIAEGRKDGIAEGRKEGIAEGRKDGIADGELRKTLDIARNMKALNLSADVIAKATGLSPEEIANL